VKGNAFVNGNSRFATNFSFFPLSRASAFGVSEESTIASFESSFTVNIGLSESHRCRIDFFYPIACIHSSLEKLRFEVVSSLPFPHPLFKLSLLLGFFSSRECLSSAQSCSLTEQRWCLTDFINLIFPNLFRSSH